MDQLWSSKSAKVFMPGEDTLIIKGTKDLKGLGVTAGVNGRKIRFNLRLFLSLGSRLSFFSSHSPSPLFITSIPTHSHSTSDMSSLKDLPLECLTMVFSEIHKDRDSMSLARLLRVCKIFQDAILPVLYENPFGFFREVFEHRKTLPKVTFNKSFERERKLIALLLKCVSDKLLTNELRTHYQLDAVGRSKINYLRYLRHVHLGAEGQARSPVLSNVTWALCHERAEHLKSVTINPSDIRRYQNIVGRFTSLTQVHFQHVTPHHDAELTQFLQEHIARVGTLQDVLYPGSQRPQHQTLWGSLPLIDAPETVGSSNWDRFFATIHQVDVRRIKSIQCPFDWKNTSRLESMQQVVPYLRRCWSLESYEAPFFGTGADAWHQVSTNQDLQDLQDLQNMPQVMLKHFKTGSDRAGLVDWVGKVMNTFRESLESVSIRLAIPQHGSTANAGLMPYRSNFGENWPTLNSLRRLELCNSQKGVAISAQVFFSCSQLEELVLMDAIDVVSNVDVLELPFCLGELKELRLGGRVAATFNPDSLHNSPKLEILHLGYSSREGRRYQPNHATGNNYWMWPLPKLRVLELCGQRAMDFHFSGLALMPELRTLFLETDMPHHAVGMERRRFNTSEFAIIYDDYCYLPPPTKLESLHLGGRWDSDVESLEDVFRRMMPNLQCVSQLTSGIDGRAWIQATAVLEHLHYVRTGYQDQCLMETTRKMGYHAWCPQWYSSFKDDPPELWSQRLASWQVKAGELYALQTFNQVQYDVKNASGDFCRLRVPQAIPQIVLEAVRGQFRRSRGLLNGSSCT